MIDLFSGAGGLSVGLEDAGFKSILAIDNDKSSIETYLANHKDAKVILGDIGKVDIKQIKKELNGKKIKLICGGPPCQGFSTVGKNDPNDSRNRLFLEFVRFVREFLPDYILVENVTGLVAKKNEKTLQSIFECFGELGYAVDIAVLSAHHYGVPEKRRRTIILGNRFGVKNIFPQKTHKDSVQDDSNLQNPNTVGWAFESLIYDHNKKTFNHDSEFSKIKNELEFKRIKHIPEGMGVRYEVEEKKYLPKKLWFDLDWQNVSEGRFRQSKLKRLDRNEPSPTINTFISTYYHPIENRYLTPREAAAIQSFPADFQFSGSVQQQWRQIGNAVPPLLAKAIGLAILQLDKKKHTTEKHKGTNDLASVRSKAFVYKKKKTIVVTVPQIPLQF